MSLTMEEKMTKDSLNKGYFFEELSVGMSDSYSHQVSDQDIKDFARISGDHNAVHLDEEFAKNTMFKGRIAHGMLSASYISTVLGTKLPGPGSIYVSQNIRFKRPVRIGDVVEAKVSVLSLNPDKKFVDLKTECYVNGQIVMEGEATIMVPSQVQKQAASR